MTSLVGLDFDFAENLLPFVGRRILHVVQSLAVKLFKVLSCLPDAYKGSGNSHLKIIGSAAKSDVGKDIFPFI